MPRNAANTIFSTATMLVGSGASSRSSISLVKENPLAYRSGFLDQG
jgi:hypothetical protein